MTDAGIRWTDVEAAWDDPAVHDAFVESCRASDNLRHAAECYRERLARSPEDAVALKRQKQLVALAMMSIDFENARRQTLEDDDSGGSGMKLPVLLAMMGAAVGGLGGMMLRPAAAEATEGACSGMMQGSVLCLFPLAAMAVPMALIGGVIGFIAGFVLRRPRL